MAENAQRVRERIEAALVRSGRGGGSVTIVGVTKTMGPERVAELIRAGISDIGENRIQEFLGKAPAVALPCRWHLIGTLQRNKAPKAIGRFSLIHSLDSVKLAGALDRLGGERNAVTRVLMEVNTSGEASKHGFTPAEAPDAAGEIARLPHLKFEGLMTVGPLTGDVALQRKAFKMLFELRSRLEGSLAVPLPELSMGMSDDFEAAVEEGATIVRLGRVLLGERMQG
ncbi:MAG: YggS family pyridoxal phosphate-dependent enzyme [Chitinivibrionia bacterium]|nr:YggS family pyridoxal phosphate-dependent enzyme [Chitinivibrionia bacterium]